MSCTTSVLGAGLGCGGIFGLEVRSLDVVGTGCAAGSAFFSLAAGFGVVADWVPVFEPEDPDELLLPEEPQPARRAARASANRTGRARLSMAAEASGARNPTKPVA